MQRTPLYETHVALAARMVDFAGWRMPLSYGSQISEHHAVRDNAGVFDVSHMLILDLAGRDARSFLERVLANDVGKLRDPGKALYSCMLREDGGILDDLIVYWLAEERFRIIANAATRSKDLAWLREAAIGSAVELTERSDLALLAVQGPRARELVAASIPGGEASLALEPFHSAPLGHYRVARTGYTGEDGFEVMLPGHDAAGLWAALNECGVAPCGLGARDTLRLEAGLNLYGTDMDESVNPLQCGLKWTVALSPERDFIGRAALERQLAAGLEEKQVGLILEGKGVLRAGYPLRTAVGSGVITSGSYSPTLDRSIGLARVPLTAVERCQVQIRDRWLDVRIVKPPFVRHGEIKVELPMGDIQ